MSNTLMELKNELAKINQLQHLSDDYKRLLIQHYKAQITAQQLVEQYSS